MKIDVEGHEKDVILGSKKILITNRCLIQVEILDDGLQEKSFKYNKCI